MSPVLAMLILLPVTAIAASAPLRSVVWSTAGADAEGVAMLSFFQLFPDGSYEWKTSGRGAPCAQEAGLYGGRASSAELEDLVRLGERLAEKQKRSRTDAFALPQNKRQISTSIRVENGAKLTRAVVSVGGAEFEAFFRAMAKLHSRAKPVQGVQIEAQAEGKQLRVRFRHLGESPLRLALPERADEAFSSDNRKPLRYVKTPANVNLVLTKENPIYELRLSGAGGAKRVYFNSGSLLHHMPSGEPLALCGLLTSSAM